MYNVLIVDDEFWVRKWLKTVISKFSLPLKVVECCENAEGAIHCLQTEEIHIIITDINMPITDGLELIRKIKGKNENQPKVIIVSGYDDFSYAKEAIELEVMGYLLKPIDKNELKEVLEKTIFEISHMLEIDHANVEKVLLALSNEYTNQQYTQLSSLLCRLNLFNKPYCYGILQTKDTKQPSMTIEELRYTLEKYLFTNKIFMWQRDQYTFELLVINLSAKAEVFNTYIRDMILNEFVLGISTTYYGYQEINQAIDEARDNLITNMAIMSTDWEEATMLSVQELYMAFLSVIRNHNKREVKEYTLKATAIFSQDDYNLAGCQNFYFVVVGEVIKYITDRFKQNKDDQCLFLIRQGYEFSIKISKIYNIYTISNMYEDYMLQVIDHLKIHESSGIIDIVNKVEVMIQENYATDINLGSIADDFDINPSYLSKKFKEYVGSNFVDYLTSVRIKQAKNLLRDTRISIKEVSALVGFREAKYFSKVFVSTVGERASEYRTRMQDGAHYEV